VLTSGLRPGDWTSGVGEDGKSIESLVADLTAEAVRISEPGLKRVPAPFPADHPHGDLLRRKGLTTWIDLHDAALAFGDSGPANCVQSMWRLRPIIDLLAALG
jgi:uncharacterized protein (DUF2461 family)